MKNDHKKTSLLLVEDALPMAHVYKEYLADGHYEVLHVDTGHAAREAIRNNPPEIVLLDLKLPDINGLEILNEIRSKGMDCVVIVITANGSIKTAIDAMQRGADDFLVKPFNGDRLLYTLKNALDKKNLSQTVKSISKGRGTYCGFIGSSIPMQAVYRTIDEAAPSKASIFITGESGTGKEVCAEAIHRNSGRRNRPFVTINCAAIPRDLMESEIFGHAKGAFTGAVRNRTGAAEEADGGTLLLDEICDMDLSLQAKLLRFLQTGEIQKVGGNTSKNVDVRIICATNKSPWMEVEAGQFREDLYFRLHVIPLELPALRERGDDIIELALHFLENYSEEEGKLFRGFDDESEIILRDNDWVGNVRELQNTIRNMVVLNTGTLITSKMLPIQLKKRLAHTVDNADEYPIPMVDTQPPSHDRLTLMPMKQVEWNYIQEALSQCGDNVPKAAAVLDISPSTIYRRIREFYPDQTTEEALIPPPEMHRN